MQSFRDVETAAYCPRKLYYRRREPSPDQPVPDAVTACRELAFEYEQLLASDAAIERAPIEVTPTQFRSRLGAAKARLDAWQQLSAPPRRDVFLSGKDCRGIAHKLLADPVVPSLVFAGKPPEQGVWEPQTVRLVAAAKALSWERERRVEHAYAEYPAYGVIRKIPISTRRAATYRRALRAARSIDGPPPRVANDAKCDPCEYRPECGVRTRSAASLF
jgi:CRISPR-associated exonuclease Cas4